jgi:hypothetical protein
MRGREAPEGAAAPAVPAGPEELAEVPPEWAERRPVAGAAADAEEAPEGSAAEVVGERAPAEREVSAESEAAEWAARAAHVP